MSRRVDCRAPALLSLAILPLVGWALAGCAPTVIEGDAVSATAADPGSSDTTISSTDEALTGCDGTAYSTIPADHVYYLTTFGGSQDKTSTGTMSCGGKADGVSFYIASRQRFGCHKKVRLTATQKSGTKTCVIVSADDYGPAKCVEDAAHKAIIDASPAVAKALFGVSQAGWSDKLPVIAEPVDDSMPVGTDCTPGATGATPPAPSATTKGTGSSCFSSTWQLTMGIAECVESSQDKRWYQCTPSGWTLLNQSFADGSQSALLKGGDAGPCTLTHAL